MASAEQLKALLRSHLDRDDQRFFSIAMQVAAHEARQGHGKLAEELRAMIDDAKRIGSSVQPVPIARARGELSTLLVVSYPSVRISDMVLDETLGRQLQRIIREQRHAARIVEHGLSPRRKLLLMGPPGTGKTLTASVLAAELGLPLMQVRLDSLITKFMGETAAKLRQVFDATNLTRGVYFFDEFDAIGSQRGSTNDVGEIRRILNSFLQMIEQDRSNSLIIAATNHAEILDPALFRRFDDVLHYHLPAEVEIAALLRNKLCRRVPKGLSWKRLATHARGLSHADVSRAAEEAIKDALIHDRELVTTSEIGAMLKERQDVREVTTQKNHRRI